MKALVTGATGFVGGHVVEALVRRGDEVTALVRSPAKAGTLATMGVRQIAGDLHTTGALGQAVEGQDVIYHVAGRIAARTEAEFLHANRDGTANLLEAARRVGGSATRRVVFVSSMAAGGPSLPGRPLRGNEAPRPLTRYGRSKLAAEAVVRDGPLPWTIVRPPMVYGPNDAEVLKVFKLARTGVVPIFGDGSQELSAIYGPDLAEALIAAAGAERAVGKTYYACHPEIFTSRAFVHAVAGAGAPLSRRPVRLVSLPLWLARSLLALTSTAATLMGATTILTPDKANEFFQNAWTGDPAPLVADSGWTPYHDLAAGLAATAEWYRAKGWL